MDNLIGQQISQYRIVERLGGGGMGEVYRAEDTRLGRDVALKLLTSEYTQDEQRVQRFEREARAASALNHPNIVTIHDVGDSEVGRYIVMESISGRTLRTLRDNGVSLEQAAHIGAQIARALAVAHAAGIVHRDIKPDNVMVRADGYVKVVDFGLVRLVPGHDNDAAETQTYVEQALGGAGGSSDRTHVGALLGTVNYMSPEQARGEPVSGASDLFSLGILLYELSAGQHPFVADSAIGVLQAIVSQDPLPPSQLNPAIPADLDNLIIGLLEKDGRLRPQADETIGVLEQFARMSVSAEPVAVTPISESHVVGRQTEQDAMHDAFKTVAGGRGCVLCITGEPGIGKSTLVDEFLKSLENKACSIARGRCSERLAGSEAYLSFLEALESLLRNDSTGVGIARTMKLMAPTWYMQVAPLASQDSDFAQLSEDVRVASQERMKRELSAFLADVSRRQPLVLQIDDVHWADVATVDLLAYLATKFDGVRMLVLATARPSDLMLEKHPFLQVKLDLQSRGLCQEIPLGFLGRDEIDRYLALEFPQHQFPADLAELIHSKTEGNPLFMVDLVRYLRDREVIAEREGRWRLVQSVPDLDKELPESVRSMIQRKIDQLDADDRKLLVAASVQGDEFDAAVVAKTVDCDPADVEEQLETLDRVHAFVAPDREHELPDGTLTVRYRFVHALYQNTLYASLRPTRRTQLSATAAGALLEFHAGSETHVAAELAFLFEAARDFEKAADNFEQAARNAAKVYANEEAVELTRRAAANADKLKGEARLSRLVTAAFDRAQFHMTLSRFEDAVGDFELGEKLAEEAGDVNLQIEALCGCAMAIYNLKQPEPARAKALRALELAREANSPVGVASAEAVLGAERMCSGDLEEAEELFDHALPVLKEQGIPATALEALTYRALLHAWRLEYDQSHEVYNLGASKARDIGACFHMLGNLFSQGMSRGNSGRISHALDMFHEGLKLAELNGDRYWLPRLPNSIGWLHRELQDLDEALRLDGENIPMAREFDMAEGEANAHTNLAHDYLTLGETDRAWEHLQAAQELHKRDVWFRWRYAIRLQAELAQYWILKEDLTKAGQHAQASLEQAIRTQSNKYVAWGHKLMGNLAAMEDHVEAARQHFESALHTVSRHPCPIIEWKILREAAAVADQCRDSDKRDEYLGRARSVITSLADSVTDNRLQQTFLKSEAVRSIMS